MMARMQKEVVRILLPMELGESAREPARLLGAMFSPPVVRSRALHVARVAAPSFYLPPGLDAFDSLRRQQLLWEERARKDLKRQIGPLEDAGFRVEVEVTAGSTLAEVLKRGELWRADLIVARPHVRRPRSAGLGSVAAGLLQAASAPVLLYRNVAASYRIRRVLAPVDFSPFSRGAVRWALLAASVATAELRLIHVLPQQSARWAPRLRRMAVEMVSEERRRVGRQRRLFGSPTIPVEAIVIERKDPAVGILAAQRDGVDLVVVGASGKTGISSVLGSVTWQVVRDCPCPVLVIPTSSRVSAQEVWRRSRG
jgi:nucleotide-binding universal stress UspA family protein